MSKNNITASTQKVKSMNVMELVGAAEKFKDSGDLSSSASLYKIWIETNSDNGLLYAVLFNYSAILTEMNLLDEARECLEKSTALNPEFAPSRINLGRLYERTGSPSQSLAQWSSAVDRLAVINGMNISHKVTALNQMARVLEGNNQDETAETLLRQSLEIDPAQREVAQHFLAVRQRLCEWPLVTPWDRVSHKTLMSGLSPLSMAVFTDDPMLQLACNWNYNLRDVGEPEHEIISSFWAAKEGGKRGPLRIGYLSSDLREHAIGFLMAELFELHNHENVEVHIYYCGVIPDDKMMQRYKKTIHHWTSITELDDVTAARRIADDGIQILVDVNGYTRDGRTKLVALRPAPVIVNWLGFPGSMASPYHHYIIADDWVVPKENEIYFSEKVLRLPCYQPNDRKRAISEHQPTRQEMKLPEDAMVYCCFNGTQKISRYTFERWLTILNRVPNSVLWLLGGTEQAQSRLLAYAEEHHVKAERIIFADKMPNPKHLARYPLADLFLDTSPYGAHTTASDALWMGVPVLTFSGRAFASRVCGSLVRSAGLSELACASSQEFIDRAVALGKDKEVLQSYRDKLASLRDTCDLFNTPKLVEHLEALYQEMWEDYQNDRLPKPNLANMDAYFEIGISQDHDAIEVQSMKNYTAWWRSNVMQRHRSRPLATDDRLWTIEAQQKETGE